MNTIEEILSYLDKIQGMSAVGLVFLISLVIGYVWRLVPWKPFPNESIPVIVVFAGAFNMSLIADSRPGDVPFRVWFMRNVLVGAIIGFVAWLSHNFLIKRLEDWLQAKFPGWTDTVFFKKTPQQTTEQEKGKTE